ncbi:ATP-binding protein [Actinomyces polynesiensis]|uniref:ATP-binding protein n=1 Tax=Actinomyces polynesiensis TaxID=1325934 RepID=UPI0009E1AB71|nr:ATP-binding protein [Actinomyces polynesiensis]
MPTPWVGGVCSGISVHLGVPVWAVRTTMALLLLMWGSGALLYLWLVLMVPVDGAAEASTRTARLGRSLVRVGSDRARDTARNQLLVAGVAAVSVALAAYLLLGAGHVEPRDILAALAILAGLGLVWSQGAHLREWRSPKVVAFIGGGSALMLVGAVLLVSRTDNVRALTRGGLIGVVVAVGLVVALAPLWFRMSSDMSAAREEQVRDAERADIAAHLHDSVLQTLTLIRASAEDPTRVRALALTQERELRSWLYTGHEAPSTSLAEALREAVGQVESTYGVAVDVVTVGDVVPGPAELALVAAAAEAVTNAVRHGAPPVSVYCEVDEGGAEVFVKDAGSGFDPDAVPEDRHGVRHSIIGRMGRVGGSAQIRPRDTGTEVHLWAPRSPCPDGATASGPLATSAGGEGSVPSGAPVPPSPEPTPVSGSAPASGPTPAPDPTAVPDPTAAPDPREPDRGTPRPQEDR